MNILDNFNKSFNKTYTSFIKLNIITKVFLLFLILTFMVCLSNFSKKIHDIESFSNFNIVKKYEKKTDKYDDFICKYYDTVLLDKNYKIHEFLLINTYKYWLLYFFCDIIIFFISFILFASIKFIILFVSVKYILNSYSFVL